VAPTASDGVAGVTAIDTSVDDGAALDPPQPPDTETIKDSAASARANIPISLLNLIGSPF
jgi:hypothetical protein